MAALQLKNRTRQAPKPMLEGRSAVQTPLLEDRSAAETPMLEDRSATETPMPDEERIAEQPLLEEGRNRNAKEPPESGIAAKRVRFETIASPDSGSTASYPPYPVHKHIRHQEQQKEADAIVSKNGGFGNFFTSPPAPVGGRGPTKEQQQVDIKSRIWIPNNFDFFTEEWEESHWGHFKECRRILNIVFGLELGPAAGCDSPQQWRISGRLVWDWSWRRWRPFQRAIIPFWIWRW
jgi:hypothetical protein